mmetsp:Transcript_13719/g.18813  ORF Transcript_13719/g.18813 Transcript_13719/m.18813 type:complete len:90 (+) Transcript_13719:597-866(+)
MQTEESEPKADGPVVGAELHRRLLFGAGQGSLRLLSGDSLGGFVANVATLGTIFFFFSDGLGGIVLFPTLSLPPNFESAEDFTLPRFFC